MNMSSINRDCLRDHGVTADARGAWVFGRRVAASVKISSEKQYRAAAKTELWVQRRECYICDDRLIEVGFNRVGPRAWVAGEFERFWNYWRAAAPRPDVVGSSYNMDPEVAYLAMRAGIPARLVRFASGATIRKHAGRPAPRAYVQKLRRIARACGRTSVRHTHYGTFVQKGGEWLSRVQLSSHLLETLGRLCPELQRVAVETLRAQLDSRTEARGAAHDRYVAGLERGESHAWDRYCEETRALHVFRVRDVDWSEVGRVQAALVADRTGAVRASLAVGRRAAALGLPRG